MNANSHWNLLFQKHQFPCVVIDQKEYLTLYYNEKMGELFEKMFITREKVMGEKIFDVMLNDGEPLSRILPLDWEEKQVYEGKIYNKSLNQDFNLVLTPIEFQGESYYFCRFEPISGEEELNNNFELAMSKCIKVLQEKDKIPALLMLLGQYYDAEMSYLYQVDKDNKTILCKEYWISDPEMKVVPNLAKKVPMKRLVEWFKTSNEVGVIEAAECHTGFCTISTEADLLYALKLKNIAMSVMCDGDGEPVAVLAVSNRENMLADFRLLQTVSQFVEADLSQFEMKCTLNQINNTDMLTGFYSRASYSQKVDEYLLAPPKKLGVVFANINGLKLINTEFGYAKGDSYIKKATEVIKKIFETNFYRISGDEFIAFFPDMDKEAFETMMICAQKAVLTYTHNYFSMGHAWSSGRLDPIALIKEADAVMYINKQNYYHSSQRNIEDINDSTLGDLLSYLQAGEFMIYLQAQMHLSDRSLYGAEALIRRYDKTNEKMVFPDQFISLYEKKSVIRHVDIFVVEQVCQFLQRWGREGKYLPISVNLSRVTLQEYGIVDTIAQICDKYAVPRKYLVIEVTERVGLVENNVASSLIRDFHENGFKISLDDFGCAYSNIVTLAQIQVDEVKLDKSLVDDVAISHKNFVLVKNVLQMCNELENTSTLAEGIEVEEQAELLGKLGCHLGQGYFFSRPVPVAEFEEKFFI